VPLSQRRFARRVYASRAFTFPYLVTDKEKPLRRRYQRYQPPQRQRQSEFFLLQKETTLGKLLAQEVERSSKLIDDRVVTEYLSHLAQNLAKNSDAKFPITVRLFDSNEINAFTLPGGYQYVNRGLILAAESEAELAGVLAHGIAHTALRSSTVQATKGNLTQLASIPAMIFTPYSWAESGSMFQGLNLAIPLTFLKFSRDAQLAADFYAVQYLYKAGYNAESYPQFLETCWSANFEGAEHSQDL
jgi:beta-barrel assembly-enhancing protease